MSVSRGPWGIGLKERGERMGGYLEGSKVIALSDLLTGRNKLHLRGELCVVGEGLHGEKERRKGEEKITLMGNKSLQKLPERKTKTSFVWEHFL